jgi:hypothetical protein
MLRLAGAVAAMALALASCRREALSERECRALLDRYTELLVRSDRDGTTAAELVKIQAAARARAAHDAEFKSCSARISRSAFDCAMAAQNVDKMEQCLL